MKKISILLIFLFCLFMTGCTSKEEKEAKSLDDFSEVCINNGFTIEDNTANYTNVDYITESRLATLDTATLEMVIYDNVENATKAQDSQIETFSNMKGSGAVINKDKGANYYNYNMITNGYYTISTRVDNTLIFSRVPVDYKDEIETIINALGY